MLASDALSQQTNGRLNQQLDLELQQRADVIANDVGTRSAAVGAAGFDANVLSQLNATDLMMDQYLNKRAGAIDGYLNMSQKTQRDIQSIDARTAASRQQRATQAAQIQQRYDQRTMDFRMANPVHRRSAPLFDYDSALAADNAMWGAGKQRAQGVRDGIAAGVDLVKRSANAYGRAFEKALDALENGLDSYNNAGAANSIAHGPSFTGQLLKIVGVAGFDLALSNDGQAAYAFYSGGGVDYTTNAIAVSFQGHYEKAFNANASGHIQGFQVVNSAMFDVSEATLDKLPDSRTKRILMASSKSKPLDVSAGFGGGFLFRQNPLVNGQWNTDFSQTTEIAANVTLGFRWDSDPTGRSLPSISSVYQYAPPDESYFSGSLELGICGKLLYAVLSTPGKLLQPINKLWGG